MRPSYPPHVSLFGGTVHGLSQRKPHGLPYKWPLLADGQDPSALEARLAFHLHRLNLTGEPLREALHGKAKLATALTQARASVNHGFITELAAALNLTTDELLRPLFEDETREWSFYRASATNKEAVWSNALAIATDNNLSLRALARTIGMKHTHLVHAAAGAPKKVFTLQHAELLSALTDPPVAPESILPTQNAQDR